MSYRETLRYSQSGLDPLAALRSPVDVLAGVSSGEKAALAALGIETVFDLATSPLFELSCRIAGAVNGEGSDASSRYGLVPGGVGAETAPEDVRGFSSSPLTALRALSATEAGLLSDELQVETVADLGRWPAYRAALTILEASGLTSSESPGGDDMGAELTPRLGEFPTERRYFSTLVVDHVDVTNPTDLAASAPIDISPALDANFGFSAPAVGALLTFEQSWFAHGITLGNLLHSVSLAPGESTRIAIVDWSRQTRATGIEAISETEALTNSTLHNRAISEVQDAVATEVQTGFSESHGSSLTGSGGVGFGLGLGPLTIGGSAQAGYTTTDANSFSTSTGSRDLAASMSQKVMDSTQQAASSVRGRRASIVKEIAETEQESVSTRILANYNHMHALTVQYYEVIELYRVLVRLHEAGRCLFIPMKLVEFDEQTIARYQGVLADAALTRRTRELLSTEFGMVTLEAVRTVRPYIPGLRAPDISLLGGVRPAAMARAASTTVESETPPPPPPPPPPPTPDDAWVADEVRLAARLTATHLMRPGSSSLMLPKDAVIEGISPALNDGSALVDEIVIRLRSGVETTLTRTSTGWLMPGNVQVEDGKEILLKMSAGPNPASGRLTLQLSYRGSHFPISVPVSAPAGATNVVVRFGDTAAGPELAEHLAANKLHYNQAIWRSLDASTVALLFSPFSFEGQPVADLIDPRAIQVAGNYLVFRMPGYVSRAHSSAEVEDDDDDDSAEADSRRSWLRWQAKRGLRFDQANASEQLVPVPTGGVFAEAVLGRSNSAEKLDPTRFWNWQDSPIPLQPSEIAAIGLGSRAQPVDVTPGQLGQPVLNIVSPTSLPDPTGLGPMLTAIQNGSMFRDMSGLAATIGLAGSLSDNSTEATADAGKLAAANLAVAAQKEIEKDRIAAQLAMTALGAPGTNAGTPKNISEMGAMLNHAQKRDRDGATGPGAPQGGGATGGTGAGSTGGGSTGGTPGAVRGAAGTTPSNSDTAFSRSLFGALGAPGMSGVLANVAGSTPSWSPLTMSLDLPGRLEWPGSNFPVPNDVANRFRDIYNERIDKSVYEGPTKVFGSPISMVMGATEAVVDDVRKSALAWIANSGTPQVATAAGRSGLNVGIYSVGLASAVEAAAAMRRQLVPPTAGIPTSTSLTTPFSVWYAARRVGMVMAWLDRAIRNSTTAESARIAHAKEVWETGTGAIIDLLTFWAPPGVSTVVTNELGVLIGELGPKFDQQDQSYQEILATFREAYKRLGREFFSLALRADLPANNQLDPSVAAAIDAYGAQVLQGWDAENDFLSGVT